MRRRVARVELFPVRDPSERALSTRAKDRELASRRREYETQVALYAEAIARATGEAARGLLLIV